MFRTEFVFSGQRNHHAGRRISLFKERAGVRDVFERVSFLPETDMGTIYFTKTAGDAG